MPTGAAGLRNWEFWIENENFKIENFGQKISFRSKKRHFFRISGEGAGPLLATPLDFPLD